MSSLPGFKPQPPRRKDVITLMPPPLPPLPRLHVMPPPPPPIPILRKEAPPRPDVLEDARTNNFDYDKILLRTTALDRLVNGLGHTRTAVIRVVDQLRVAYQMRLAVRLQAIRQQPRRIDHAQLNKWVVSIYKLVGFAVLTLIVLALVMYLGSTLFYWYSTSWIMPTVIAPTDERVLQLSSTLAVQASARDKLAPTSPTPIAWW